MKEFIVLRKRLTLNISTLLQFEGIFKLLTIVILVPVFTGFIRLTMWMTGYSYLTAENIIRYLTHPLFLIPAFLLILLAILYIYMDMSAVTFNLHKSYYGSKTDIYHTLLYALRQAGILLSHRRQWGVGSVILIMLPVFGIPLLPALMGNMLVREVLVKKLVSSPYILAAFLAALLLILFLFFYWMYVCQIQLLEKCSSREAMRRSVKLGKGHHFQDYLVFLLVQISCYLIYAVLLAVAMLTTMGLEKLFTPINLINPFSTSIMLTITTVAMMFLLSFSAPGSCMCIASLYYFHKVQDSGNTECIPDENAVSCSFQSALVHRISRYAAVFGWLILTISIVICGVYVFMVYRGRFNPNIEYLHKLEVTAHRGASRYYPENTMAAFRGAVEQEADWIELDIHQSRDGQLFVMHDSSLYRTTGMRAMAWDLDWEDISRLDAGSRFHSVYGGEPVPLLSEVIDFAVENHVRLNIEIKPSRYEEGMEKRLVALLQEKNFINDCVVTSQKYSAIQKVKECDESITTVYVMGYAYGRIDMLSAADNFSVSMSSVTNRLVSRIHNAGKQIYVWTVNRRHNVEEMIQKNVDNIITDDVPLAKKIVGENWTSDALYEYRRWINRLFL